MQVKEQIIDWLQDYATNSGLDGFVVGVSGGVDSAVVSTLCSLTGRKTYLVSMPIRQGQHELIRANNHMEWLRTQHPNVEVIIISLTGIFHQLECLFHNSDLSNDLSSANSRSRLRMLTLYHIAQCKNSLVVGTGNKVEDFGVGFYTKYGDGGVDVSPIADLFKSEVRALAKELGISNDIVKAAPTDGLWNDGRTDESQLGATYDELEKVMKGIQPVTERDSQVIDIYNNHNRKNSHKMNPIPVCMINRG
jgi:NAD+ synthase